MRIQDLAIIFVIIILPISIVLSVYTQNQIQTIKIQTEYDTRLTAATSDAIKAFQINTINSSTSDLANSKIRDIEASVETFKDSIKSVFGLNGYTEEQMDGYIPALVYTMYDGFYIYSNYNNQNYTGLNQDGENVYGLKPYISYSAHYTTASIDVIITYTLDNYITIQGMINDRYYNESGYLIDGIQYDGTTVRYNGIVIENELLYENLPAINGLDSSKSYPYIRFNGTKYYYDEDNARVFYFLNGKMVEHVQGTEEAPNETFNSYHELITNNDFARRYYIEAYEFTNKIKNGELSALKDLRYEDAMDYIINDEGDTVYTNLYANDNTLIFDFNTGSEDVSENIECEKSNFNQHRLQIIKNKIRTNLAIAVANYNSEQSVQFQMPELSEEEWSHIMKNISLISFVQGIDIGGKIYNGYTIVNNSESKEVVREDNIYIIGNDGFYHRIGDRYLLDENNIGNANVEKKSAGRLNLDFNRQNALDENENRIYYYTLNYYASYYSVISQNDCEVYDDIYAYIAEQNDSLKEAFYTALGRERYGMYKTQT